MEISGETDDPLFLKVIKESDRRHKTDKKKVKVPQYMLDLFASVTDRKTGKRREDIRLPGNIVRSFYSLGKKKLGNVLIIF